MTISYDGSLGIGNLDVQELVGLGEDELRSVISAEMPELTSAELTTFLEDINERLSEIEDELKELQDGYEDDMDEAEDADNAESSARYEKKLEEVNEALESLELIDDAAQEAVEHEALLNIESSEDINWSYDTNDLDQLDDGDAVTITALAGSQTGLELGSDDEEDEEVTDVNVDGFITYDDYLASESASEETLAAQDVFLQINSGDRITLLSESGDTTVFQITTASGKTITLNVAGDANIFFEGSNYLDVAELSGWSESLLQRSYDNTATLSFYDQLNDDEISDEERLAYMDHYEDIIASTNFDAAWAVVTGNTDAADTDLETTLSSESARGYYESAVNALCGWVDDTSSTKDMIPSVWNTLFETWTAAGLSDADVGAIVQALVMGVLSKGSQALFQTFFAPVIATLEDILESDKAAGSKNDTEIDAVDKMVIMLLETQSGATTAEYGGTAIWTSTAFATDNGDGTYTEGWWKDNHENIAAIGLYKTVVGQSSWALITGSEDDTIAREEAWLDQVAETPESGVTFEITQNQIEALSGATSGYADKFTDGWNDGITENTMKPYLDHLVDLLQENDGKSLQEVAADITDYIGGLSPTRHIDDTAAAFLYMLHQEAGGIFDALKQDSGFVSSMKSMMKNEDDDPDSMDTIITWLDQKPDDDTVYPGTEK